MEKRVAAEDRCIYRGLFLSAFLAAASLCIVSSTSSVGAAAVAGVAGPDPIDPVTA